MSVKIVDLQNEAVEEVAPITETIEEARQSPATYREAPTEIINEVVEETNEPPKEEVKEEVKEAEKPKPKRQTQKDKMNCGKCGKEMTIKTYRYSHEKNCQGRLSERPVKPKAKPQPKAVPKPVREATSETRVPQPKYEENEQEEQTQPQPVKFKLVKPEAKANTLLDFQHHYQLLQQQYMKQIQEKYNNLCQNMFKTKLKNDKINYNLVYYYNVSIRWWQYNHRNRIYQTVKYRK